MSGVKLESEGTGSARGRLAGLVASKGKEPEPVESFLFAIDLVAPGVSRENRALVWARIPD
jgi:hypothetical protein